jgi:hypothetical protein
MIRKVLIAGAALCFGIGLTIVCLSLNIPISQYKNNVIGMSVLGLIVFLAFAPLFVLMLSKPPAIPKWGFIVIGLNELFVIFLFVAMLFPRL